MNVQHSTHICVLSPMFCPIIVPIMLSQLTYMCEIVSNYVISRQRTFSIPLIYCIRIFFCLSLKYNFCPILPWILSQKWCPEKVLFSTMKEYPNRWGVGCFVKLDGGGLITLSCIYSINKWEGAEETLKLQLFWPTAHKIFEA